MEKWVILCDAAEILSETRESRTNVPNEFCEITHLKYCSQNGYLNNITCNAKNGFQNFMWLICLKLDLSCLSVSE